MLFLWMNGTGGAEFLEYTFAFPWQILGILFIGFLIELGTELVDEDGEIEFINVVKGENIQGGRILLKVKK